MRLIAPLLLAGLLLGTADKTYELAFLPKAEKGHEEKIEFDVKHSRPIGDRFVTDSAVGTSRRTIKSLDDDGLPSRELLTLEETRFRWEDERGGPARASTLRSWTGKLVRDSARRRASMNTPEPELMPARLVAPVLLDDPDALVRLVQPARAVAKEEEWAVDAGRLLAVLGPPKARIAEVSTAVATLTSMKKGVGRVSLQATLHFTTPGDPEGEWKMTVSFQVRGPIDGSAPPHRQTLVVTRKQTNANQETKETLSVTLWRRWVDQPARVEEVPEDEK